jgi:hypothetical protein
MTTFFNETFTGSGALEGHEPDVSFAPGVVWGASVNGIHGLSGGYLVETSPTLANTAYSSSIGVVGTNYGNASTVTALSLTFTTPPTMVSQGGIYVRAFINGIEIYGGVYCVDGTGTWNVAMSGAADIDVSANIEANTEYVAVLTMVNGASTFAIIGEVLNSTQTFVNSTGLNKLTATIGAFGKISSIIVDDTLGNSAVLTTPLATLTATGFPTPPSTMLLTAPRAVLSAYGGANAALAPPSTMLSAAGHDSTGEQAALLSAPAPVLLAFGGGFSRLTAPRAALAATATSTGWGNSALTAPKASLAATGRTSAIASASLVAPLGQLIGYAGAVLAITGPMGTLQARGTTGSIGGAALVCPLFELAASGTAQNHGSARLIAPMPGLSHGLVAYLVAPAGRLNFIGHAVVIASYEAYAVNLSHRNEAPDEVTRYTNFPFTHIVRYQNSYFGVASGGLYLLEGTTDDGAPISYAVRTCIDDLEVAEKKTAASVYLAGRIGPTMTVTLHAGETGQESYAYSTPRGQGAQNHREKFGRGVKNRYFALALSGTDALELDSIELEINKLNRRL